MNGREAFVGDVVSAGGEDYLWVGVAGEVPGHDALVHLFFGLGEGEPVVLLFFPGDDAVESVS